MFRSLSFETNWDKRHLFQSCSCITKIGTLIGLFRSSGWRRTKQRSVRRTCWPQWLSLLLPSSRSLPAAFLPLHMSTASQFNIRLQFAQFGLLHTMSELLPVAFESHWRTRLRLRALIYPHSVLLRNLLRVSLCPRKCRLWGNVTS